MHKILFFSFCAVLSTLCICAQFTEKRKKGPSMGTLKESCCKSFGDVLQGSARLLCSIGSVQQKAIAAIEGYVNGDKASWCETASKQKLTVCKERLSQLQVKIDELAQECADTLQAIAAV